MKKRDEVPKRRPRRISVRERRYRRLLNTLPDPIIVVAQGRIRFANRAAAHLLGAESTAQLRQSAYEDFVLSASPLPQGGGERQELRRLDGEVVDVEAIIKFNARHQIIVLRDISHRDLASYTLDVIHNEEQIRLSQRMEAIGRLSAGIAHDFNNLLTAIHGHAQLLVDELPAGDSARSDAQEILNSAGRATALTRQLLAFTRGSVTQRELLDMNQIVTSIKRLIRRVISENIDLVATLESNIGLVRGNPTQVEQVLVNLIVNARDAMPDGGTITIKTANVELATSGEQQREEVAPGKYVMIAVSDTGVGMDKELQGHIFEPFFTTKAAGKGTGVGLATVYSIVKQSGGHIFVYSEPGQGTTFKVYLPRVANGPADESPPHATARQARSGERILLVEDDASVRTLAKRVLDSRGYQVIEAASGQQALAAIKEHSDTLSLIITDVMLPDYSGVALVEAIHGAMPRAKILMMSGYTAEDVERQGIADSIAFLEKPFTPSVFAAKVREVLDH